MNRHDEVKKHIKKSPNSPTSASEKSVHKRSNTKVIRSQKNSGSRTHQNRAKRHN
jgi:hypothetical protein